MAAKEVKENRRDGWYRYLYMEFVLLESSQLTGLVGYGRNSHIYIYIYIVHHGEAHMEIRLGHVSETESVEDNRPLIPNLLKRVFNKFPISMDTLGHHDQQTIQSVRRIEKFGAKVDISHYRKTIQSSVTPYNISIFTTF